MFWITFPLCIWAQSNPYKEITLSFLQRLQQYHFAPLPVNDEFSEKLFQSFLNTLDPKRLYFCKEDYLSLSAYSSSLDDELKQKSWNFIPYLTALYKNRLEESKKIIKEVLEEPFTFTSTDKYEPPSADTLIFPTKEQLNIQWKIWLTYQALHVLFSQYAGSHADSMKSDKELLALEKEVKKKVENIETKCIDRILNHPDGYENYVFNLFLQNIASLQDPHTIFFSKSQYERFEKELSTEQYSLGLELEEDEYGNVFVSRVTPGGPAWKSSQIHRGDRIISVSWVDKSTPTNVSEGLNEIINVINLYKEGKLNVVLAKPNGQQLHVQLQKQLMDKEENIVKSYVLKGEKKIGYISLPGFYTDWEEPPGNIIRKGCANDVAKEIVKLRAENIEGLILDLRNNGGGSVLEGLNLAGIFIDEGPIYITQEKNTRPIVVKDINRGSIYDGPLLVMINGMSASASEIVAAALQDYNRAILVGSTTYGKATAQIMTPVFSTPYGSSDALAGILKITNQRLYRITAKSNQIIGVSPHIFLPERLPPKEYKEKKYSNAYTHTSIDKKVLFFPHDSLPIQFLAQKSQSRILHHPYFKTINEVNRLMEHLNANEPNDAIPLQLNYFRTRYREWHKWNASLMSTQRLNNPPYQISLNQHDLKQQSIQKHGYDFALANMDNLQKDAYIHECYFILSDYIDVKK
ncbi:MAG: carboxy terminal-processing peptidase [Cytophagaceae bacterium]|nr:carboxy terminal-processing peptidase [Cytophagaceae bacterium]MDW8456956.1 carboxy terminal-processing peptidase [Cytophagaceae bacterium]